MVNVEGKILLRCAERDAQCASSGLVWKEVISRGEMREEGSHLERRDERRRKFELLGVDEHTEAPSVDGELPRRWQDAGRPVDDQAPCRC